MRRACGLDPKVVQRQGITLRPLLHVPLAPKEVLETRALSARGGGGEKAEGLGQHWRFTTGRKLLRGSKNDRRRVYIVASKVGTRQQNHVSASLRPLAPPSQAERPPSRCTAERRTGLPSTPTTPLHSHPSQPTPPPQRKRLTCSKQAANLAWDLFQPNRSASRSVRVGVELNKRGGAS